MKIYIGSDHRGFELKSMITKHVATVIDTNPIENKKYDYPMIAHQVSAYVKQDKLNLGILICGTGIGMSIAANKNKGIRAALCRNVEEATLSRQHNMANILCLSEKTENVLEVVDAFINTNLDDVEERHLRRVLLIE